MRKLCGLLLAIALAVPVWPQAQPKPSPSPTRQATVQPIITATLMARAFIDLPSPTAWMIPKVRQLNAGTVCIHSANIVGERSHIMGAWRGGFKTESALGVNL